MEETSPTNAPAGAIHRAAGCYHALLSILLPPLKVFVDRCRVSGPRTPTESEERFVKLPQAGLHLHLCFIRDTWESHFCRSAPPPMLGDVRLLFYIQNRIFHSSKVPLAMYNSGIEAIERMLTVVTTNSAAIQEAITLKRLFLGDSHAAQVRCEAVGVQCQLVPDRASDTQEKLRLSDTEMTALMRRVKALESLVTKKEDNGPCEAIQLLTDAMSTTLSPRQRVKTLISRSEWYLRQDQHDLARQDADSAMRLGVMSKRAFVRLASIFVVLGATEDGMKVYSIGLEAFPTSQTLQAGKDLISEMLKVQDGTFKKDISSCLDGALLDDGRSVLEEKVLRVEHVCHCEEDIHNIQLPLGWLRALERDILQDSFPGVTQQEPTPCLRCPRGNSQHPDNGHVVCDVSTTSKSAHERVHEGIKKVMGILDDQDGDDEAFVRAIGLMNTAMLSAQHEDKQLMIALRSECYMRLSEHERALQDAQTVMRGGNLTKELALRVGRVLIWLQRWNEALEVYNSVSNTAKQGNKEFKIEGVIERSDPNGHTDAATHRGFSHINAQASPMPRCVSIQEEASSQQQIRRPLLYAATPQEQSETTESHRDGGDEQVRDRVHSSIGLQVASKSMTSGDFECAIRWINRHIAFPEVLASPTTRAQVLLMRAQCNLQRHEFKAVIQDTIAVLGIDMKCIEAYRLMTSALHQLNRHDEAVQACVFGLNLQPDDLVLLRLESSLMATHAD